MPAAFGLYVWLTPGKVPARTSVMYAANASTARSPRFAKRFANLGDLAVDAFAAYITEVRAGTFPGVSHTYKPNAAGTGHGPALRPREATADELDAPLALDLWH